MTDVKINPHGKDVMSIKSFFVLGVIFISIFARAQTPAEEIPLPQFKSFYYDYKARRAIENKKPDEALDHELKVLENEPYSVQIHSNLGIIFDLLQKKDESGQSFQQSLDLLEKYKSQLSPADAFQVYYNLGVHFGALKETAKALEFYQKALDINPASVETKHNIELLIQQQQGGGKGDKDDKDKKDKKDDKGDQNKDQQKKDDQGKDKPNDKDREQNSKYKPRPFKGDQLNEYDVKKILGELQQQDKKIRANFNKKERKEDRNEKDW